MNHPNRGCYAIRCNPHYFAGDIHRRDRDFMVRGAPTVSDESTIVLARRKDAETICGLLSYWAGGPYHLDDNQYDRPSYEIVPYRGDGPAISTDQAARRLGYGFDEDGRELATDELRAKIARMTS